MNVWIFIVSVIVVFAILVVLNFENMYNYYTYVSPIQNIKILDVPGPHGDPFKITDKQNIAIPIKNIEYIAENNTITVTFGGGKSFSDSFGDIPAFSHVQNFHVNQTFAFRCVEYPDFTFLGFYKYLGIHVVFQELRIILWHYEGETHRPMPCDYPEIITHSIDLVDHDHSEDFKKWIVWSNNRVAWPGHT